MLIFYASMIEQFFTHLPKRSAHSHERGPGMAKQFFCIFKDVIKHHLLDTDDKPQPGTPAVDFEHEFRISSALVWQVHL